MKRRWLLWLSLVSLAFGTLLAYLSAVFSSRSGDAAPLYSTRRHDPYGTAALYDLLTERGMPTRTLERASLDPGDHGVLVQVLPARVKTHGSMTYHVQTKQVADWIAQGNTVVQLTRTPTELMEYFKIAPDKELAPADLQVVELAETRGEDPEEMPGDSIVARLTPDGRNRLPGATHDRNDRVVLRAPMTLADRKDDSAFKPLARISTQHGAIVAAEYKVGRGSYIVVGSPSPALNNTLGEEGNLEFLLGLIGDGPLVLDEWSHGIGHDATIIGFLLNAGLLPMLLQAGFVAGLYIWSTSGQARDDEDTTVLNRSGSEQIATLGYLYNVSLGPALTFERVNAELLHRLARALRCKPPEARARVAKLPPDLRDRCTQLFSRLGQVLPPQEVRCLDCGYDLRGNTSGRCPECGEALTPELRRRVELAVFDNPEASSRIRRSDVVFIEVLKLSHQLSQEIRRDLRGGK